MNSHQVDAIIQSLSRVEAFLGRYNVVYSGVITRYIEELEDARAEGGESARYDEIIRDLKSNVFRGMGSFNDIVIVDDVKSPVKDLELINKELEGLKDQLYRLVTGYLS